MTKNEIADKIRDKTGFKKKDILLTIDCLFETILKNVDKDKKVEFRGFGTFSRNAKKARKIFSPITKKVIDVLPRSILVFKSSKMTDRKIN